MKTDDRSSMHNSALPAGDEADGHRRDVAGTQSPKATSAAKPKRATSLLAISLELYGLIENGGTSSRGLSMAELRVLWSRTGFTDEEFALALLRALKADEFELFREAGCDRIRSRNFENRNLDPKNLDEIERLVGAYRQLAVRHGLGSDVGQ